MKIRTLFEQSCTHYAATLQAFIQDHEQVAALTSALDRLKLPEVKRGRIIVTSEPCFEPKAQHLVEELVGKFKAVRPPVPAVLATQANGFFASKVDTVIHFGCPTRNTTLFAKAGYVLNISLSPKVKTWQIESGEGLVKITTPHFATLSLLVHLICELFEPDPRSAVSAILKDAQEAATATSAQAELLHKLDLLEAELLDRLALGGLIFTAGNGGSACDTYDLGASVNVVSLLESGYLTCVANDFGFEHVFSRAVECLDKDRDMLLALSTSGKSPNIVAALKAAQARQVFSIFLGGAHGGPACTHSNLSLLMESTETARIQELHALLLQVIGTWLRKLHKQDAV